MSLDKAYQDGDVYDEARYVSAGGELIRRRESENFEDILKSMGLEKGDTIMEVGAGTGMILEHFKDDYHTIALDISQGMLEVAERNNRADEYIQKDIMEDTEDLPSADHVYSSRVFHLVDDPEFVYRLDSLSNKSTAFNYFRKNSSRWVSSALMNFSDKMPEESALHSDKEVDQILEDYEDVVSYTDFAIPYGAYRTVDNRILAEKIEDAQEALSELFRDRHVPDFNTVGYRGIKGDQS